MRLIIFIFIYFLVTGCDGSQEDRGKEVIGKEVVLMETDETIRIESVDIDSRYYLGDTGTVVYEFTPKTAEHMKCLFVEKRMRGHQGIGGAGGLFCFKKERSQQDSGWEQ